MALLCKIELCPLVGELTTIHHIYCAQEYPTDLMETKYSDILKRLNGIIIIIPFMPEVAKIAGWLIRFHKNKVSGRQKVSL